MQDERPFITLGQFLKQQSIISTGGEAKNFLLLNSVEVNGEKETRRGRKLRVNDRVTVNDISHVVSHMVSRQHSAIGLQPTESVSHQVETLPRRVVPNGLRQHLAPRHK